MKKVYFSLALLIGNLKKKLLVLIRLFKDHFLWGSLIALNQHPISQISKHLVLHRFKDQQRSEIERKLQLREHRVLKIIIDSSITTKFRRSKI